MKSVAFHNLGCKVNSYELDVMQQMLQENGYKVVPFDQAADVYIVNTCTVTNIADRKSRQMLHQAKKRNPNAVVVAVGCYVQTNPDGAAADDCIDLAIGNNRKTELPRILADYLAEHAAPSGNTFHAELANLSVPCEYEPMTLTHTAEHTRAYIKIQDGCNQFCSYCVIPYARGRVRSRGEEEIIAEIRGLAAAGYREAVLTGIHISSYGLDFEGKRAYNGESRLIDLIERVHNEVPELDRIRLGSLEPRIVTEETVQRLAALPRLCPHFHLSLQSGCAETLRRMNRRYTPGEYLQGVDLLRRYFDHPAITTDVIVGFPGETEEEFTQTCAFLEDVRFYEMHIFKYSKRAGTRAADMPGQLTEREKARRSNILFTMEAEHSRAFRADYIGRTAEVLWEDVHEYDGRYYRVGHTPDYVKVAVEDAGGTPANTISPVHVRGFLTEDTLWAEKMSETEN